MSGTIGRPKGSKNKPDHQAGGVRVGSGPKRQGPGQASGSTNLQTTTASTQPHTAPGPKLTQKPDSVTQGSVQIDSNTEAIHPPSAGSDSEPDSDFEDLLDEAVPSKSLPEEASINTDGVISLYLTGIKTKLVENGQNAMRLDHSGSTLQLLFSLYRRASNLQIYIIHLFSSGFLT
ncbi:hypothetical protein B0H11DRAFT_1909367 [Mycena galericulata]|nr:hypothetical protein B0H11DRAFT_1909367 [Mycena galericulata]